MRGGGGRAPVWAARNRADGRSDPDTTRLLSVDGALWYVVEINGEDRLLPAEDVFHIKGLSHNGLSTADIHAYLDGLRQLLDRYDSNVELALAA